jgi:hypothetical protein
MQEWLRDLALAFRRVVDNTSRPTKQELHAFVRNELVANSVGWTAGLLGVGLVDSFMETRGLTNLWGLLSPRNKAIVSAETYAAVSWFASYATGLFILIVVRHFLLRTLQEYRAVRADKS